jgi:hypothetical protein
MVHRVGSLWWAPQGLRGPEQTMDEARVLEWTRHELDGGGCEISGGSIANIAKLALVSSAAFPEAH